MGFRCSEDLKRRSFGFCSSVMLFGGAVPKQVEKGSEGADSSEVLRLFGHPLERGTGCRLYKIKKSGCFSSSSEDCNRLIIIYNYVV